MSKNMLFCLPDPSAAIMSTISIKINKRQIQDTNSPPKSIPVELKVTRIHVYMICTQNFNLSVLLIRLSANAWIGSGVDKSIDQFARQILRYFWVPLVRSNKQTYQQLINDPVWYELSK